MNGEEWKIKEEFLSPKRDCFDCHSSSIVALADGKLHAVWKGGPGTGLSNIDMKENVGIWSSTFDGNAWTEAQQIVCAPYSVCWNPVLCALPSDELLLFYRVGPDPRRAISLMRKSSDGGTS